MHFKNGISKIEKNVFCLSQFYEPEELIRLLHTSCITMPMIISVLSFTVNQCKFLNTFTPNTNKQSHNRGNEVMS